MKGPVLLFNTKIDFLVPLKCLSSDTGVPCIFDIVHIKLNYQGSSLINQMKNTAGKKKKKANCEQPDA